MPPEDPPINGVAAAAAASESASSPRVSSIASGTEGKPRQDGPSGIVDPAAPGMDTHHWAGVRHGHRDIDARSVASSMAAEKDALSVNEHQDDELDGEHNLKMQPGEGEMLDVEQEGMNGLAGEPSVMEDGPDVLGPPGISIGSLKSSLPDASTLTDGGSSLASTLSPRGSEVLRHISLGGTSTDPGAAEDGLVPSSPRSETAAPEEESAAIVMEDADIIEGEEAPPSPPPSAASPVPGSTRPGSAEAPIPLAEEESSVLTDLDAATNPGATVRMKPVETHEDDGLASPTTEVAGQSKALQSLLTGGRVDAVHPPPVQEEESSDLVVHPPGTAPSSDNLAVHAIAPLETTAPVMLPDEYAPAWEETFKGLVHADGVDTLGRPVVVLDADAVPRNMKSSAARFVVAHLSGLVERGPYVLVLTARKAALPGMWVMGAYTTLPRPFRKNVKRIVLVRPTPFLRAMLVLLRPLMSSKAARKISQVDSLRDIGEATEGEVQLDSLGPSFLASEHAREELHEQPAETHDPAP